MNIAGIQNNSFVDYPGKIAAVIFTSGCNMDCFYCHNRTIVENKNIKLYDPEEFIEKIILRKGFLDGVVITGGEPTLQPGLEDYIKRIKELDFSVKLDTNGTNPGILSKLIANKLIDYIAMDIKAPIEKYEEICGSIANIDNIRESINIIMENAPDYEFRTTFIPQLDESDIKNIVSLISGAKKYVLQQFRKPQLDKKYIDIRLGQAAHKPDYIRRVSKNIRDYVQECEVRGL